MVIFFLNLQGLSFLKDVSVDKEKKICKGKFLKSHTSLEIDIVRYSKIFKDF